MNLKTDEVEIVFLPVGDHFVAYWIYRGNELVMGRNFFGFTLHEAISLSVENFVEWYADVE